MSVYFLFYLVFVIIYIIQRINPLKNNEIRKIIMASNVEEDNKNNYNTINYEESKNNNYVNKIKISENNINNKIDLKTNLVNLNIKNKTEDIKETLNCPPKKDIKNSSLEPTYNNQTYSKTKDDNECLQINDNKIKLNNNDKNDKNSNKKNIKNKRSQNKVMLNFPLTIISLDSPREVEEKKVI